MIDGTQVEANMHCTIIVTNITDKCVFVKFFEAASAEKASSSLKKDSELSRSATVFTAHWGGRKAVIGREGKRERWGANCVPLSLSLVGLKVVFC